MPENSLDLLTHPEEIIQPGWSSPEDTNESDSHLAKESGPPETRPSAPKFRNRIGEIMSAATTPVAKEIQDDPFFGSLNQNQQTSLIEAVRSFDKSEVPPLARELVRSLFLSYTADGVLNGYELRDIVGEQGLDEQELLAQLYQELGKSSLLQQLLSFMNTDPFTYRFQIGFLLGLGNPTSMPMELQKSLGVDSPALATVVDAFENWAGVCRTSELYFDTALADGSEVYFGDFMVVKVANGMLVGLCIRNHGQFREGNFYSPTEKQLRHAFIDAFIQGKTKLDEHKSVWMLQRASEKFKTQRSVENPIGDTIIDEDPIAAERGDVNKYKMVFVAEPENLILRARRKLQSLPEKGPEKLGNMTRAEYREEFYSKD